MAIFMPVWRAVAALCFISSIIACPPEPKVEGKPLAQLIKQNSGALLVAIPNMRCTNAIQGALLHEGIASKTVLFDGQFQYSAGQSPIWDWLHCTYKNDKAQGTTMHSYFFFDGKFIGEGFEASKQVSEDPSRFKAANLVPIASLVTELAWAEPIALVGAEVEQDCSMVASPQAFLQQYDNIFKTGNRNAASHLWSSFLFAHSGCLSKAEFLTLNEQFCAISGSPLGGPPGQSCYASTHVLATSQKKITGQEHHCCAPCYCDAKAWTAIDTKTVKLKDGDVQFHFFVIGNPCQKGSIPDSLSKHAPEIQCTGSNLKGATESDNGHVIIGMFFTGADTDAQCANGQDAHPQLDAMCVHRSQAGDKSGMGKIFIDLAKLNPVVNPANHSWS